MKKSYMENHKLQVFFKRANIKYGAAAQLTVTENESTQRPPPGSVLEVGPSVAKVSKSSLRKQISVE